MFQNRIVLLADELLYVIKWSNAQMIKCAINWKPLGWSSNSLSHLQFCYSSHSYCVYVLKFLGKPSAPRNAKSLVVNSTSIWFFWDAAEKNGGKILYYTLYYNADKETGISSINITGQQKANYSTLLTGLKQLTTYMIYISATNGYGQGKRSRGSADKTVPAGTFCNIKKHLRKL